MSDARKRAIGTLKHYLLPFQGHKKGEGYDDENVSEIESIVDDIIEAAVEKLEERLAVSTVELKEEQPIERSTFPLQPIVWDGSKNAYFKEGLTRFQQNDIVRYLLDAGPFDLNHIAVLPHIPNSHHEQFAMLIGYSIGGFGELSYVSEEAYEEATRHAGALIEQGTKNPDYDP